LLRAFGPRNDSTSAILYPRPISDLQLTGTSDRTDHVIGTATLVPPTGRGRLRQVLGVSFGIAVLIGNTILIGILRTPGDVAAQLPSPALFIGVWIIGGLYALLGAISLAEPGAMLARSGGQYVIVRRGLGFPETVALLRGLGHDVAAIGMSEYRKMDGGLSCLSVRW